jgi:hypothetical protein
VEAGHAAAFGRNTFRTARRGAISYFVGSDPEFPEDTGFALKRWVKPWYDNDAAENRIQIRRHPAHHEQRLSKELSR